ncbi:MAG: hypothetical protein HRU40_20530 [Saprospiraceae bacterium]|nr:hypothetical protein [Saprospiraceae bacterium]
MKEKAINILRNMISSWGKADDPSKKSEALIVEKYLRIIEQTLNRVDTLILADSFQGSSPDVQVIPECRAWESVTAMCESNGYPYNVKSFSDLSNYREWVRTQNDGIEDEFTFNIIPSYSNKEYTKELSLICCLIRENEIIKGSLFQSFDEIFCIAQDFIAKYPLNTEWGIELEFEQTVLDFARQWVKDKQ